MAYGSEATRRDFARLLPDFAGEVELVPYAFNFDFRPLDASERDAARQGLPEHARKLPSYLLMVGSAHARKNRETAIRALALLGPHWPGVLVFAGEPLSAAQWQLAADCGVDNRLVEITSPGNEQLRLLYNEARALLFPSRHEGFGWPLIESQACGCPGGMQRRGAMPQVTGGAAVFCHSEDAPAFANRLLELERDTVLRADLVRRGFENAQRYSQAAMIRHLEGLFERVVAQE